MRMVLRSWEDLRAGSAGFIPYKMFSVCILIFWVRSQCHRAEGHD
jgi:hypothetical protein